ncbi:recombination regulator RecX [Tepidimonas sp.]|uniref:recombination regulator RecX n=1 Tax=Tepidimonas sp. TaxID=2002775 RepID=UPI002FE39FD7
MSRSTTSEHSAAAVVAPEDAVGASTRYVARRHAEPQELAQATGAVDDDAGGRHPSLKARALRLLAQRDYTRAELAQRLASHAPDAAALQAVLNECVARGWLDEQRAVDSLLRRRAERWGAQRVQAELRARGVDAETLRAVRQRLDASELERALALWQQRFGRSPTDARERARQLRFLVARGFAADVARRVVPPASAGAPGDDGDA